MGSQPANSIRDRRLRLHTSPDAWLQSTPANRRELKAWQTGGVHAWYFGMKAHIGVDAASGLVHTVVGTAANVSDINVAGALLHGEEHAAFGDSGVSGWPSHS
jgi:IS5 family transposase